MGERRKEGGFAGRLLYVDLDAGEFEFKALPDADVLREVVGGIGLGLRLLLDDVPPHVQASDPEAPLMFMAGPLAGTAAPSSSNLAVVALNRNTPYAAATGHSHGFWAAYLKHAGYDGVVFTGRAAKPSYLWIDDDHVELRDASSFWGLDTRETERRIKLELGDEERISVACIGPAGEAMLPGASIKNDRNHGASKGSLGAIMGSKRLKAVAVRGSREVPLAHRERFVEVCGRWEDAILAPRGAGEGMPALGALVKDGGTMRIYNLIGAQHILAAKNWTDPVWGQKHGERMAEEAKQWVITPRESYNCPISCSYDCNVTTGPFAGLTASLCGGGENIEGASAMIGVEDPGTCVALTEHCDAIGIDSSVVGGLLGMAYELFERGVLTVDDTEGLELRWGNHQEAMTLLDQMCSGEGFGGRVLAKGLVEAARLIGRGAEGCVLHIRGGGINMHDWRPAWSVLLGQIVAGAGVCWQGPGVDTFTTEPDLGYTEFAEGTIPEGKAEAVARTQAKKLWEDCLGVCWFACWGVKGVLEYAPEAIEFSTGWTGFDRKEALRVGERIANLQRVIAIRRGFRRENEFDVSPRLLEAPQGGIAEGKSIAPHLEQMVNEYYSLMGWDENGRPTPDTLKRMGLEGALQ
jgi:aldehyde:ferredoxin oxidoreductase